VLVKFTRRHTSPGRSPFEGDGFSIGFTPDFAISPPDHPQAKAIEFPAHWSTRAQNICLEQCFIHDGIACDLVPVAEDNVPAWLWRHEPDGSSDESRGETSLCQIVDRITGGWTYQGWKGGYFDSEEDARIFYDECRWLLFHQKISPSFKQWKNTGRYWAYGHDVSVPSTYLTDFRTGTVRRAENTDLPPHGMVINTTGNALAGEGGMWDLWRREGEILAQGGHCGANVSNFLPVLPSGPSAGNDSPLADILAIGDSMAQTVCSDPAEQPPKRRLTIDSGHPDARAMAKRIAEKTARAEAETMDSALTRRHIQAIIDSCGEPGTHKSGKRLRNPSLQLALQSARQALLPMQLIDRVVKLAEAGLIQTADDVLGDNDVTLNGTPHASSSDALTIIGLAGSSPEKTCLDRAELDELIQSVVVAAWSGQESGLHFQSSTDSWNTCGDSGQVRSASGDGSFMFLDDTASDLWLINAPAFMTKAGAFNVASYQHSIELTTIAADLSLMTETAITPRLARRVWDFRPLSLSLTGLSQCLVAAGIAFDSSAGRAFGASLHALLTSTAYRISAHMASELGQFPSYAKNTADMLRVLDRHSDMVATCAHETAPPGLVEAVEETWLEALLQGADDGFRNAHVSVLGDNIALTALLGSASSGLIPIADLITSEQSTGGYNEKRIDQAIPQGLSALGYDDQKITAIVRHVTGHGTLTNAPGVNHATLRKRGFTETALNAVENALTTTDDISQAFSPFLLGEDYCRHMLGFTSDELLDDYFDMLAALGFSDAGIEAANIYCCGAGTLEGAPHLAPEHLAVFDCAEPQGARGARFITLTSLVKMMGAVQPHISGAIGQTVPVPAGTAFDDYRELLDLAWHLNLKSITLKSRVADPAISQPNWQSAFPDEQPLPVLAVIQGGQSLAQSSALPAAKNTREAEAAIPSDTHSKSDVADKENKSDDVAKPSRRALLHAARSSASVSSSADVVVEQRHV